MELKQYWGIVRSRAWIVFVLIIAFVSTAVLYTTYGTEKKFTAQTKLIVSPNQGSDVLNGRIDIGSISSSIQLIKTYKEIIRSPRIMNLVAQEHPELQMGSGQLIASIQVISSDESQVMTLLATDSSYPRAAVAVNAVAKIFQREIPTIMKVDNVTILSTSDPNLRAAPSTPGMFANVFISIIAAFVAGAALIVLIEYLSDRLRSQEELEELLQLPVYASIPKVKKGGRSLGDGMDPAHNLARGERNVSVEA